MTDTTRFAMPPMNFLPFVSHFSLATAIAECKAASALDCGRPWLSYPVLYGCPMRDGLPTGKAPVECRP